MSNLSNDAKQAVADSEAAATAERRRVAARLIAWLGAHPRTVLALAAAAVVLAAILGAARG